MMSRESACAEWEARLHVVEEKYGVEFSKMSDEVSTQPKHTQTGVKQLV